jgi:NAD(P)-dependent dehydrogenase (short-subunit alcohol dehydrogenase family)
MGPTADTDEAAFDGLFRINVKAPFFLVAALAPKDRCPRQRIDHRDVQRSQAIVVMYEPTSFAVC